MSSFIEIKKSNRNFIFLKHDVAEIYNALNDVFTKQDVESELTYRNIGSVKIRSRLLIDYYFSKDFVLIESLRPLKCKKKVKRIDIVDL